MSYRFSSPVRVETPRPVRVETPRPEGEGLAPVLTRAAVIFVLTAGCVVSVATGRISPVRVAFAFAFLLFAPGLAIAELLEIRDLAQRFAIATSVSLGLETLLAVTLAYAKAFSVGLAVAVLAAMTLGVSMTAIIRARRERGGVDGPGPAA